MKKIFFSLIIIGLLFSAACNKPAEEEIFLAAGLSSSNDRATELDDHVTFTITVANPAATTVTVTGDYQTTVSISGGTGSFSPSPADLGLTKAGDRASFTFTANSEGNPTYSASFTLGSPWALTSPGEILEDKTDDEYLYYKISTASATVTGVTVETKVGVNGTYTNVSNPDGWDTENDSILAQTGTGYTYGDTIFYRFTATAGSATSVNEMSYPIEQWTFTDESEEFTLDATNEALDLSSGAYVDAAADTADFVLNVVGGNIGFSASATDPAVFIADTGTPTMYSNPDIPIFSTTVGDWTVGQMTAITNFEIGDVYLFKTVKSGDEEIIGVLKIINVNRNLSTPGLSSVTFKYLSGK